MKHLVFYFVLIALHATAIAQTDSLLVLPPVQHSNSKPLMEALALRRSERNIDTTALPLQEISNILWAAYGINRPESGKRTAPSAMNIQNISLYVFLPQGIFLYDAHHHSLQRIRSTDERKKTATQHFAQTAPVNIFYVANLEKPSQANVNTRLLWAAIATGCIVENVHLYCASAGLGCVVRAFFREEELQQLLPLHPSEKIIIAQTVGFPK